MREIDSDVWAKYTIDKGKDYNKVVIDDLRYQMNMIYVLKWL